MSNNLVGLKILLQGGHFLQIVVEESEIPKIMDVVARGVGVFSSLNVKSMAGVPAWLISAQHVVGLHQVEIKLDGVPGQQPILQQQYKPWAGRSG